MMGDLVNRETVTDWLDLAALVLVAIGLGALAGGWWIGTAVLGLGLWALVTGVSMLVGSVLIGWHNDARRAPAWWPPGTAVGGERRP